MYLCALTFFPFTDMRRVLVCLLNSLTQFNSPYFGQYWINLSGYHRISKAFKSVDAVLYSRAYSWRSGPFSAPGTSRCNS